MYIFIPLLDLFSIQSIELLCLYKLSLKNISKQLINNNPLWAIAYSPFISNCLISMVIVEVNIRKQIPVEKRMFRQFRVELSYLFLSFTTYKYYSHSIIWSISFLRSLNPLENLYHFLWMISKAAVNNNLSMIKYLHKNIIQYLHKTYFLLASLNA